MNAITLRERLRDYDPDNPGDEVLAAQLLATLDLIDRLQADIDANGVTIIGARGQTVANPSVAAVAKQRLVLAQLLARVFPPDDNARQRRARRAAMARWRR